MKTLDRFQDILEELCQEAFGKKIPLVEITVTDTDVNEPSGGVFFFYHFPQSQEEDEFFGVIEKLFLERVASIVKKAGWSETDFFVYPAAHQMRHRVRRLSDPVYITAGEWGYKNQECGTPEEEDAHIAGLLCRDIWRLKEVPTGRKIRIIAQFIAGAN